MAIERPRGVRDFGPQEMVLRQHVEGVLAGAFESFGFRRVQTPTFELLELFGMKSGQDIREHLYVFDDRGGRKLCLRPEATASVARMYANDLRSLPKPLRLYYVGPMFRYEEPQKGRYREFWQAGVELIGVSGHQADAEVVCLASECLRRLNLKHTLRVSHIGVLRRLLDDQGFKPEEQDKLIQALDKGDFKTVREKVHDDSFNGILAVKGGAEAVGEAMKLVSDPQAKEMLEGLRKSLNLLDSMKVPYTVDFSMARGLDYYTGIVFDARVEGLGAQNQVCGGGRYDNLISLFGGPQTPAVGFAFGLDRLNESIQSQDGQVPTIHSDVCVVPASSEVGDEACRIAVDLRRELPGTVVDMDLSGRKLNKALQHASDQKSGYAVIVGAAELKDGAVILKDMLSQTQEKVPLAGLVHKLSTRLGPK